MNEAPPGRFAGDGHEASVETLTVGPLQSNCYVARRGEDGAVVVDPGHPDRRIRAILDERWSCSLEAILLTHAHLDHVAGVSALEEAYEAPIYLHPEDRELYDRAPEQAASFGLSLEPLPSPDRELVAGDTLELAGLSLEVRHTPGHSPGHVILCAGDAAFVGDCVFAGSIGRTDLPGGDAGTLLRSIREEIMTLPPSTVLYPGHGPQTTVAREAESNPFLTGAYGWSG